MSPRLSTKIAVLTLAGITSWFGTRAAVDSIDDFFAPKIEVTERVTVNTDDSIQTVTYNNEVEGVLDLQRIITKSKQEDAWVYVPKEQKWVEVGINYEDIGGPGDFEKGAKVSDKVFGRLVDKHQELIFYHIHPITTRDREKLKKPKGKTSNKSTAKEGLHFVTIYSPTFTKTDTTNAVNMTIYAAMALPSQADISALIKQAEIFYSTNPSGRFISKIVSPLGITEYSLTEEGRKKVQSNPKEVDVNLEGIHVGFKFTKATNLKDQALGQVNLACEKMSTELYRISFTSYENFTQQQP